MPSASCERPVVVERNPVFNDPARVLQGLEAIPVDALLLQRPDHALEHAVLLRVVRSDELFLQTVVSFISRPCPTGTAILSVRAAPTSLRRTPPAAP